uniref:Neurotransmitter-gated ion-channel transmembrane domain-containing protein n=1 Tax=Timema bartmani TaxID=61472 RepID=A0A7R9F3M0_9NEOP|nr:unnamed protein product [Timema bartmani]
MQVDLRHMDEKAGSNVVDVGVDLSEFYMSVEWDILEVPAVRAVLSQTDRQASWYLSSVNSLFPDGIYIREDFITFIDAFVDMAKSKAKSLKDDLHRAAILGEDDGEEETEKVGIAFNKQQRIPEKNEKFYTCCDEPYLDITFNITMRRKTLFYTVNIIIPCMGISFLTVLTFYLPSDSGEKMNITFLHLLLGVFAFTDTTPTKMLVVTKSYVSLWNAFTLTDISSSCGCRWSVVAPVETVWLDSRGRARRGLKQNRRVASPGQSIKCALVESWCRAGVGKCENAHSWMKKQ